MSRGVEERLDWFAKHKPTDENGVNREGLCLHHTWQSTLLPSAGIPSANAGVAFVQRNGHMQPKSLAPPRGAWVWWTSPSFGHVCLSLGGGRILSTDVLGPGTTGTAAISLPSSVWGHTYIGWSDWFVETFDVGLKEEFMASQKERDEFADAVLDRKIYGSEADKVDKDVSVRSVLRELHEMHDWMKQERRRR